jgi:F-type H+-transporting ATPase subunit b
MPSFQSLVTIAPWPFIFQICNLFILAAALKHFLFKPVQKILAQRAQEVGDTYAAAEQAKESAEAMRTEYEERLASAKEEAATLVKTADARANARAEETVNAARTEAAAIKAKAEKEIENERKRAAGELKNDISTLALSLAGKVVEREIDPTAHKELIDEFIDRVGDAS